MNEFLLCIAYLIISSCAVKFCHSNCCWFDSHWLTHESKHGSTGAVGGGGQQRWSPFPHLCARNELLRWLGNAYPVADIMTNSCVTMGLLTSLNCCCWVVTRLCWILHVQWLCVVTWYMLAYVFTMVAIIVVLWSTENCSNIVAKRCEKKCIMAGLLWLVVAGYGWLWVAAGPGPLERSLALRHRCTGTWEQLSQLEAQKRRMCRWLWVMVVSGG